MSTNNDRPSGALGFYVAAVLGVAVSLDTSWRFFGERLDIVGAERIVMFTVLEVALLACGWAMRANVQRYSAPGSPRVLAWALCGLAGYMAWDLSGPVQGLARVGLGPLLALVMLHAALGIEIRHRTHTAGGTLARIGRELRERVLSRLGLADDTRDALTRTRERAARRAARLALSDRGLARMSRLSRALRTARVGTDENTRTLMLAELAVLRHADSLGALDLPAPWANYHPTATDRPTDPTPEAANGDRSAVDDETVIIPAVTAPATDRPATATVPATAQATATGQDVDRDRVTATAQPAATDPDRPGDRVTDRPTDRDRSSADQVKHRREVKAAASTADAVAYAVTVTDYDRPSEISRWLTGHGRETSPEAVRSALRRARGRSDRSSTDRDQTARSLSTGERAA